MNRRGFLRSLFASAATIVVAPACVMGDLPPPPGDPHRTYFDMGRGCGRDDLQSLIEQAQQFGGAGPWKWPDPQTRLAVMLGYRGT